MNGFRYVKISLFFIILGAAGTVYIVMSADGLNSFNTKIYNVTLDDATGLSTRSQVYLAGVPVGKIRAIDLDGTQARLKVAFLKNVDIRGDAKIARKSSSILGTSILALDPGTEHTPIVPAGGRINAERETRDLNAVLGVVQELGGQISSILEEFQTNQMRLLAVSLETFNALAAKVNAQSDAELERISRILESLASVTERVDRLLVSREADIGGSVEEIHAALENIRAITGDIRAGRGNLGQVLQDGHLYGELLSTVEKTGAAAEQLRTALDSVNTLAVNINGVVTTAGEIVDRANGLGISIDAQGRYEFLSRQMRSGASLRLDPASNDRWYRIGVSSAPEGVTTRKITEVTTGTPAGTVTGYEDSTQTTYTVAIDAEIARRFGPVTIRGGLLENTAGVGLDVQPLKWLSLSGEVFRFRTGEAPNLRGTLTFYPFFDPGSNKPWNWLYLQGGINNSLRDERDFFIGAGVRFADREVKGLVGLAPVFGN
ncbi:MAG: MlaD family protein [Treponema sp.]|jgi:phospholipid/cholesterol/gamma-HCH transport system substrate-binding protein|nr:MlaD family protein [Treponema sp.]